MIETDVLVVGGGPSGLMLANELGRRGVRCLLVDAKPGTATNAQANATQARTMEHFRRLGFADEIRAQGLPPDHPTDIAYFTRFTGHELARLRLPTAAQAVRDIRSMAGSWSAAELPHRISQKYVEATLRKHAQAWPSNDIRYGWRMVEFGDEGDAVHAMVQPVAAAEPVTVTARYLIGCDGARSQVRSTLGIAWGGATGTRRDFMGGQMFAVHMRAPAFYDHCANARAWMYVAFNARRRAFICSIDGQGELVFHAALRDGEDANTWSEPDARRVFAEAMGRDIPFEILSLGTWTAGHSLVAQSFGHGHVFIAGDAAHLFTPTGGLGYNTGVEDAVNLGWKLASVLQGTSHPRLLDSYEAERRPVAVRNTGYARHFADSVGLFAASPLLEEESPAGAAERAAASQHLHAHVRMEFNIPGVTFGARYDGSPLIVGDGTLPAPDQANTYMPTACPGGRPPHAWLPDGRSLYDSFGAEWTLLVLGPAPPEVRPFVEAATALNLTLAVVHHPDAALRSLYQAPLALIRPDQVVAWRGADGATARAVLMQAAAA